MPCFRSPPKAPHGLCDVASRSDCRRPNTTRGGTWKSNSTLTTCFAAELRSQRMVPMMSRYPMANGTSDADASDGLTTRLASAAPLTRRRALALGGAAGLAASLGVDPAAAGLRFDLHQGN